VQRLNCIETAEQAGLDIPPFAVRVLFNSIEEFIVPARGERVDWHNAGGSQSPSESLEVLHVRVTRGVMLDERDVLSREKIEEGALAGTFEVPWPE